MRVGIIMGSDSDLSVMKAAADCLKGLDIEFEITIVSAHRTPKRLYEYAETAMERGLAVIIAGAGGAAHLPGMIASITTLPVIGVPIMTKSLNGVDSLYSIVQMPPGVPVATVAINGAMNAAILAASILATADEHIGKRLKDFKAGINSAVSEKIDRLYGLGYEAYLDEMKEVEVTE